MPGIQSRMIIDEALDVTRIYFVADQLPPDMALICNRPFLSPHHTILHAWLNAESQMLVSTAFVLDERLA